MAHRWYRSELFATNNDKERGPSMNRDAKEVVGVLMHVLDGGEVSPDQLTELSFGADGKLQQALNEAYIKLMEFAYDRELRCVDRALDRGMRAALQIHLDRIVAAWEQESPNGA
jgi:hypothetical protein